MLNEETIENYKRVEKLVRDKFELTDESNELFSKLLFNPEDAIEFEKIASQPDRRLFVEDCLPARENDDTPWQSFRKHFPSFIGSGINYSNFIEGKVADRKIVNVFIENSINVLPSLKDLVTYLKTNDTKTFESFVKGYYPKSYDQIMENIVHCTVKITDDYKLGIKVGKKTFKKIFNIKETEILIKSLKTPISDSLNKNFFGAKRPAGKTICFSLNYADWFLASTGESWYSCVDFKENIGNWRGLPGLVGDKNRILIYVTDKKEKEFHGVKTPRMLERTWAFLYKNKNEEKMICCNRNYPSGSFNIEPFKEHFPKYLGIKNRTSDLLSLYTFPTIFHKPLDGTMVKLSASIVEDTHAKKLNPENINESYYDTSNGYGVYTYSIKKDGTFTKYGSNKSGAFK